MSKFRHRFIKRISLACCLITAMMVLLAFSFQGLFFLFVPAVGEVVAYVAKQAGYDFGCYDLHGDWKCRLNKVLPADEEIRKKREQVLDVFKCHNDSDCIVSEKGGCALKGFSSANQASHKKCVCVTGPTIFGCFSEEQVRRR